MKPFYRILTYSTFAIFSTRFQQVLPSQQWIRTMKLFEGPAEFDNEEKYFLCQIDKKYHKNLIYNRIPVTKVPDMHAVKKKPK